MGGLMKTIAIIANIISFGTAAYLTIDDIGGVRGIVFFYVTVFLATPILSIIAILRNSSAKNDPYSDIRKQYKL